jgi:hypothetical protein
MSLRDKIKAKSRNEETVTIDGDDYLLRGLSELEGSNAEALATNNGKIDGGRMRREILIRSLLDPETKDRVYLDGESSELESVPRKITGQLFSVAMRLSGYSSDDPGSTEDAVKNLQKTGS